MHTRLTLTRWSFWLIMAVLSCPIFTANHRLMGTSRTPNPTPARNARPTWRRRERRRKEEMREHRRKRKRKRREKRKRKNRR